MSPSPVYAGVRAAALSRARNGAHRLKVKRRPVALGASDPRFLSGATPRAPRSGPLYASLGLGPLLSPPPRGAHAASPASGRRPTTRGRRRRASSSWTEGSNGSCSAGDSHRHKLRDPNISKSPSPAGSGRHALTTARRDSDEETSYAALGRRPTGTIPRACPAHLRSLRPPIGCRRQRG